MEENTTSTNKTLGGLDILSTSKEKKPNSKNYFEEKFEDTKFQVVNTDDKVSITYQGYNVTNRKFGSIEEAEAYVMAKPWELLDVIIVGTAMNVVNLGERIKAEKEAEAKKQKKQTKKTKK